MSVTYENNSVKRIRMSTRWRVITLIFVLYTINCIDRISLSLAMPGITKDFAISPEVQGIILSSFFWAYCAFQLPGGYLVDRIGAKRVLGVTSIFWGFFAAIGGLAMGGFTLILSRLGLGAFEAPFMPAANKIVAQWLPGSERSRGITLIDSGAALGSAVGAIIVSSLIVWFGSWRAAFLITGIISMVIAYLVYRRVKEHPHEHPAITEKELEFISSSSHEDTHHAGVPSNGDSIGKSNKLSILFMFLGRMGFAMVFFGLVTWGPSYLVHERGMSLQYSGLATFFIFLAGTLGEISGGIISDRFRGKATFSRTLRLLFLASGTVSLLSLLSLGHIQSSFVAVAVICIGFYFEMFGGLYWLIPGMIAPHKNIGFVGGVLNFAGQVGGATVGIVSGIIVQHYGYSTMMYYYAGCAALYLVCSQFIKLKNQ
ncbi:MAG: MFS transporter [Pantoea sp.]|uniref:MFS transporter n=1 Tax=Pantoea sp. TaxID=69393 RepID=UPI00239BEFB3|nr:MFS transporter [Pantoea sp.]MDE1189031.1 MFS transporter [Pantoea sp.]